MPLKERVCWTCNLPVDKDNVYKIATICQCVRCVHCRQLVEDKCDLTCVTQVPIPPVIDTTSLPEWVSQARNRWQSIINPASTPPVPPSVASPVPMPATPDYATTARVVLGALGRYEYTMNDTICRMTTQQYSIPCIAMDAYVRGAGIESPEMLVGNVPAWYEFDHVRYSFSWFGGMQQVLIMTHNGLRADGEPIHFETVISGIDFARWQTQRRGALGGN
jgi:hypothetical protein